MRIIDVGEESIDESLSSGRFTYMLTAQGLGEYGTLAGGDSADVGSSRLAEVLEKIEYTVRHAEPTTWIGVAGVVFVVWLLFFRTR
jgi:hypothetical protein